MKDKPEFYPILLLEVDNEIEDAINKFSKFNSLHEGYAVLLEEVDELWDHVKMNQKRRIGKDIHKECIQIAAMALRIIIDCENNNYTN